MHLDTLTHYSTRSLCVPRLSSCILPTDRYFTNCQDLFTLWPTFYFLFFIPRPSTLAPLRPTPSVQRQNVASEIISKRAVSSSCVRFVVGGVWATCIRIGHVFVTLTKLDSVWRLDPGLKIKQRQTAVDLPLRHGRYYPIRRGWVARSYIIVCDCMVVVVRLPRGNMPPVGEGGHGLLLLNGRKPSTNPHPPPHPHIPCSRKRTNCWPCTAACRAWRIWSCRTARLLLRCRLPMLGNCVVRAPEPQPSEGWYDDGWSIHTIGLLEFALVRSGLVLDPGRPEHERC